MTNVIKIVDLLQKQKGAVVTIIARLCLILESKKVEVKKDRERVCRKRDIQVADDSGHTIWVTLWNNLGESFEYKMNDVLLFKNFNVSEFNGMKLLVSTFLSSVKFTSLSSQEKDMFVKLSLSSVPIDGFSTYKELSDRANETLQFCWIKGRVLGINTENCFYQSCIDCNKKKRGEKCDYCDRKTASIIGIRLEIYLEDNEESMRCTAFKYCVENWLNETIDSLHDNELDFAIKCRELENTNLSLRVSFKTRMHEDSEVNDVLALNIVQA